MRAKEFAHDYRYFPDPDLLPLVLSQDMVDHQATLLPDLPDETKERYVADFGLSAYDAGVLVADIDIAQYFEEVANGREPKLAVNWVTGTLFGALNKAGLQISESPVSPESLGELIDLVEDGTISGRMAKDVFEEMMKTGEDAADIVEEKGLEQITDSDEIEAAVDQVISDNPDQAQEVRDGREKTIGWFVGQVMQATGGKANPQVVNELLRKKLSD